jgi:hypothetical protein
MKLTSHYQNPYHADAAQADNETGIMLTVKQGVERELEDLVALELTAERMAEEEAALLGAYIADDAEHAKGFWHDLKDELLMWEITTGRLLLSAADPTRTEWHRQGWWTSEDDVELH